MIVHAGVHRADQCDVVSDRAESRDQIGHLDSTLTAWLKLPEAWQHLRAGLRRVVILDLPGKRLASVFPQHRLGIGQIHMARATLHEQRDHRPGPWRMMRTLRGHIKSRPGECRLDGAGQQSFAFSPAPGCPEGL